MVGCIATCGFMFVAWGWVDFGGVLYLGLWLWWCFASGYGWCSLLFWVLVMEALVIGFWTCWFRVERRERSFGFREII